MVASIPRNYQVDLTDSYRLATCFSQRGGLVHPKGWAAFGQKQSHKYRRLRFIR
jgi:hypothetical protein